MQGTYYRWTQSTEGQLRADILGADTEISVDKGKGTVSARVPGHPLDPDTARMYGVRLIEAAILADNGRCVREA